MASKMTIRAGMESDAIQTPYVDGKAVASRPTRTTAQPPALQFRSSRLPAGLGNQAVLRLMASLQRAARDEERNSPAVLQRSTATAEAAVLGIAPDTVRSTLQTPGRALTQPVRTAMETSFDSHFSDVRLHDDDAAAATARDVGARAYTVGKHIVFAPGEYRPTSTSGRALLAHELSHVLQQSGAVDIGGPIAIGAAGTSAEREADMASGQAAAGLPAQVSPAAPDGMALLQRQVDGRPGGVSAPIAVSNRISPGEALARARTMLKARTQGGREDVRDFKRMRDEYFFTGRISDAFGSLTHNVKATTLGQYDHVDAMIDDASDAGRRLQWPTCGRLMSEAVTELERLERQMAAAHEGAEAGAERAVDMLHMIQGLCALIAAAPVGAAAGFAVAGEAAVTAGVFSTAGLATATATGGVMAGYGMLNESAEQLAMRGAIDPAAVATRGVTEFGMTFFGHFINGALTKALGDWLGTYVNRELIASGLPARALGEGERFAVEVVSGALATPFTTALGAVTNRIVGNAPWPSPEEFVNQVMLEIPRGVLMSVLMQAAPHPSVAPTRRVAAGEGPLPRTKRVEFKMPEVPGYEPPVYSLAKRPVAPVGEVPQANDPSSIPLASQEQTREYAAVDIINSERARTVEMPADPSRAKTVEMAVRGEIPFAEFQARFVEMYKIPAPSAEQIVRHPTEASFETEARKSGGSEKDTKGWLAFYDSENHVIHLRPRSSLGTLLHEGLHLIQPRGSYAKAAADKQVGSFVDEGLTEMFAAFGSGVKEKGVYEQNIKLCEKMVDAVGMDALHEAYLHGTWDVVEARFLVYFGGNKNTTQEFFTLLRSMKNPDKPGSALLKVELLLRRGAPSTSEAVTRDDTPAVSR